MHYEAFVVNVSKKIYPGVVNIFAKTLKLENCYKIVIRAMLQKKNSFSRSQESITTKLIWRHHKSSRHILALVSINSDKAKFIFRYIDYYCLKTKV